jgi:hypothetical protein
VSAFSGLSLLAKVAGRINAVILAYFNVKFNLETSPKMPSKVKHFDRLFYLFALFSVQVTQTELSRWGFEAMSKSLHLVDSRLWASCCGREQAINVRKVTCVTLFWSLSDVLLCELCKLLVQRSENPKLLRRASVCQILGSGQAVSPENEA